MKLLALSDCFQSLSLNWNSISRSCYTLRFCAAEEALLLALRPVHQDRHFINYVMQESCYSECTMVAVIYIASGDSGLEPCLVMAVCHCQAYNMFFARLDEFVLEHPFWQRSQTSKKDPGILWRNAKDGMQKRRKSVLILNSVSDLFIEVEWINCPFSICFPVVTDAVPLCTHCPVFQWILSSHLF